MGLPYGTHTFNGALSGGTVSLKKPFVASDGHVALSRFRVLRASFTARGFGQSSASAELWTAGRGLCSSGPTPLGPRRFSTVACCEVTSGGDTTVVWGARLGRRKCLFADWGLEEQVSFCPECEQCRGEPGAGGGCPGGPSVQLSSRVCRTFLSTVTHDPPF